MAVAEENIIQVIDDEEMAEHTLVMYIGETGRKQWTCSCGAEQGIEHIEENDGEQHQDT